MKTLRKYQEQKIIMTTNIKEALPGESASGKKAEKQWGKPILA